MNTPIGWLIALRRSLSKPLNPASLLRFDEEFRLFERVAESADTLGWEEVARVSRRKAIVRLHLGFRAVADALRLRPAQALEKLRFLLQR